MLGHKWPHGLADLPVCQCPQSESMIIACTCAREGKEVTGLPDGTISRHSLFAKKGGKGTDLPDVIY